MRRAGRANGLVKFLSSSLYKVGIPNKCGVATFYDERAFQPRGIQLVSHAMDVDSYEEFHRFSLRKKLAAPAGSRCATRTDPAIFTHRPNRQRIPRIPRALKPRASVAWLSRFSPATTTPQPPRVVCSGCWS